MFVDASAIVAILGREAGHEAIQLQMATAAGPFFVSPLAVFEAVLALARKKAPATRGGDRPSPDLVRQAQAAVQAFVEDIGATNLLVTPDIGQRALETAATYGKIVGHPADLNFGDCFAYACAKASGVPPLYKGDDFSQTDLG
ncbi:type II toxin-antitoxin system VapC family toxin [Jiella sp. M17.18]|uniref:type II toxin-antitoxin system VapC family toxin n=1 Tax=Jiella sp. M17.18 TaxID=3234247 RepID=UPI0034DE1B32